MILDKKVAFIFLIPILISCNYKLLVNKNVVIHDDKGYLVFTQDEAVFYPYKDTVDANFLGGQNKNKGFKIDSYELSWLDSLSRDYSYASKNEPSKFSIIPVVLRYYLGDSWQKDSEKNTFSYKWNNNVQTLQYKVYDFRKVIMVSVSRESDIQRLSTIKLENKN